jgi:hypothetical protein
MLGRAVGAGVAGDAEGGGAEGGDGEAVGVIEVQAPAPMPRAATVNRMRTYRTMVATSLRAW